VSPVRVRVAPIDREGFTAHVFAALGGTTFERKRIVSGREEHWEQVDKQDHHTKCAWLAEQSLHYLQLQEALGRPPELKEFGTRGFEGHCSVLAADVEDAWTRFGAVLSSITDKESPQSDSTVMTKTETVHRPDLPTAETKAAPQEPIGKGHVGWLRRLRGG
jgi:hypothetical protein